MCTFRHARSIIPSDWGRPGVIRVFSKSVKVRGSVTNLYVRPAAKIKENKMEEKTVTSLCWLKRHIHVMHYNLILFQKSSILVAVLKQLTWISILLQAHVH